MSEDDSIIKPRFPIGVSQITGILGRILKRLLKSRVAWIAGGALFLGWCGPSSCSTYVPPNQVGVRQVYYGSSAGIKSDVYGPGLHFITAGVERLHLFPHDMQVLNFSDST